MRELVVIETGHIDAWFKHEVLRKSMFPHMDQALQFDQHSRAVHMQQTTKLNAPL